MNKEKRLIAVVAVVLMLFSLMAGFVIPIGVSESNVEYQYPLYSTKSTNSRPGLIRDWGIATKEDWLAAINDSATDDFLGITLHFVKDVDMESTNMGVLGGNIAVN